MKKLIQISKKLSYILRHDPGKLHMDKNGWVSVDDILNDFDIDFDTLDEIVENNNKKRFVFNDDETKIRANQGHSIKVDVELEETTPPETLYHGTSYENAQKIMKSGLKKMTRQHVHLSEDLDTAKTVGKRHSKGADPIILSIDCNGLVNSGQVFYKSLNGVWLTDDISEDFIQVIIPWE